MPTILEESKINTHANPSRPALRTIPPITSNPQRMSGTPVIGIERLPVTTLVDYLIGGATVDDFVAEFDTDKAKVLAVLEKVKAALEEGWLAEKVDY